MDVQRHKLTIGEVKGGWSIGVGPTEQILLSDRQAKALARRIQKTDSPAVDMASVRAAGADARAAGRPVTANPWAVSAPQYDEWRKGWGK